jgi:hypothetical protein
MGRFDYQQELLKAERRLLDDLGLDYCPDCLGTGYECLAPDAPTSLSHVHDEDCRCLTCKGTRFVAVRVVTTREALRG